VYVWQGLNYNLVAKNTRGRPTQYDLYPTYVINFITFSKRTLVNVIEAHSPNGNSISLIVLFIIQLLAPVYSKS